MSLYALIQVFTTPEATPGKCCKYWTKLQEDIFILTTKILLLNILFMHLFRLFYLVLLKAKCDTGCIMLKEIILYLQQLTQGVSY